jgi:hypothetical protein
MHPSPESAASSRSVLPANLSFLAPSRVESLIRVGRANDGGYVIPSFCPQRVDTLVSFGVSTDWSFEEQFRRLNPRARIQMYDHTVSERKFRRSFQKGLVKLAMGRLSVRELLERFRLWRAFRAFRASGAAHFEERICGRWEREGDSTLERVFGRTQSSNVFLKVDIEGSEYGIIDDILRYAPRIRATVIEFHDTEGQRAKFCDSVKKLQRCFEIVHLHGNNFGPRGRDNLPEVLELTLVRRGSAQDGMKRVALPLAALDSPNDPGREDYEMRFMPQREAT